MRYNKVKMQRVYRFPIDNFGRYIEIEENKEIPESLNIIVRTCNDHNTQVQRMTIHRDVIDKIYEILQNRTYSDKFDFIEPSFEKPDLYEDSTT